MKFCKKNVIDEYIQLKETYGDENLQVYVNKGLDYVSINLKVNLNELIINVRERIFIISSYNNCLKLRTCQNQTWTQ